MPEITPQEMCAEMVSEGLKPAEPHALLKVHSMNTPMNVEYKDKVKSYDIQK